MVFLLKSFQRTWSEEMPGTLLHSDKNGFSIPVRQWLHSSSDSSERSYRALCMCVVSGGAAPFVNLWGQVLS